MLQREFSEHRQKLELSFLTFKTTLLRRMFWLSHLHDITDIYFIYSQIQSTCDDKDLQKTRFIIHNCICVYVYYIPNVSRSLSIVIQQ